MGILDGPAFRRASLFFVASALQAQTWTTFHSAYQDGVAAQARGDHALALRAFSRAASLEPTPGTRVHTYGLNFLATYYPYLRMAESALALGDLPRAEAALMDPASMAREPSPQREALLARIRALKEAAKPSPAPGSPAPAPPIQAQPAPVQAAPAGPLPQPIQPPAPERPVPKPQEKPREKPREKLAQEGPAPARAEPRPEAPPAPVQPPAPRRRPWWAASALPLVAGAWVLARKRKRPARSPWTEVAAASPGEAPATGGADANLGRMFGPWKAQRILGRGGCATAYHGVHRDTGREVAIKVPHPHLVQDPEFLARFRREASLGALLEHPRIVGILDAGPPEGEPWLVMPFVRGTTLEAHLQRSRTLPVAQAIHIAGDVAEAMAHAHAKGVVHRDLKPANIMLTEEGAVVMDLGIARILEDGRITSMYIGTPTYSAPESMLNPSVGPPADRYALGIILFEMLTGHPPFRGESAFQVFEAHRFDPVPDLTALQPQVPPRLSRLFQRLCDKAPEERPEDGETLRILQELRKEYPLA